MLPLRTLFLGLPLLATSTYAVAKTTYAACQLPAKVQGTQLANCPNGTVYVSQTDPEARYGSIQAAVESLPADDSSQVILIGPGNYHEVINVTRVGPLTMLGMTEFPQDWSQNLVHIWNRPLGAPLPTTFGNVDFKAYNLDIANRATVNGVEIKTKDTGPSAALFVAAANASFYSCSFFSYQDTLYVGHNGSAVFWGGEVRGSTDYLYGFGTAWFEGTTMASRSNGGGITAWKGAYGYENTYGVYQNNGRLIQAEDAEKDLTHLCALGRPWNNASRSIYQNTEMSDIVLPEGFIIWSATDPRVFPNLTFFGEFDSFGPGFNATARNRTVETLFTPAEARGYSFEKVFGGKPAWVDYQTATGLS
ncbi:hypothetical protein FRB96_007331 [Tulasnella sp. 330]|nr:hypothetical protein FRB96_007331 [Tulasnella sp. 330]KAG8878151.1 hypothetical protein FRB97_002745 [Tulasnella sp. 331]